MAAASDQDSYLSIGRCRIDSVQQYVQEELLQLSKIAKDGSDVIRVSRVNGNGALFKLWTQQAQCCIERLAHINMGQLLRGARSKTT